ncbi:WD40 domain-containing protein [Mycolicibacterium cosmeticum]|uniref:WD40 domain-containing protein n=1 Tax=Mycolicibacterium cosmeticum TaxID=258533 RepID=W9ATV3_MYCCO|nr:WD40 domain-containing protein [Mycolicibacterium cosmeticum]
MIVSSSGGAHTSGSSTTPKDDTSDNHTDETPSSTTSSTTTKSSSKSTHTETTTAVAKTSAQATVSTAAAVSTNVTTKTAAVAAAAVAPATQAVQVAPAAATPATAAVPAAVTAQVVSPATGLVGFLNNVVTNLLNPFLKPVPNTPDPFTPAVWAVLAWVRRNVFNQAPTIAYNPTTTVQTGQTVTGNIGATDAEGDALTYKVTQGPKYGTLSIDQATGNFTYTPNDINYTEVQTDSFSVSVTDGKFNLLGLFSPHSAKVGIDVSVLNPEVQRVILDLPDTIASPANPRYSADGKSIFFAGQPTAGGRSEIYQINTDGTGLQCVTCGVTVSETGNLAKPVPVEDGSGRVLVLVNVAGQSPRYSMLETGVNGPQLLSITTQAGGGTILDRQREMRISPDGTHALYTRIVLGPNGLLQALPIVGTLTRTDTGYTVTNERVVYPTGEGKQWTPDGKGVVILGGQFDAGNVDDIEVDLATGKVTRVTANLDYDEDMDYSPNMQWIAIGSTRGLNALTPMTQIIRQNFLPVYVGAPVYDAYALPINVSNQEWIVAVGDELNRENGVPLFDTGDGYTARSMPSWNPTGDAVTFWESSVTDPTVSRLVIANLKYTTSVGPVAADRSTPSSDSWAPALGSYVAATTPLPATGTYAGVNGGTAVVTETVDPNDATRTIRTVTYTDYVNELGMILNGTESADYNASQTTVHYLADITVTGAHTGYLTADANINAFQQSLTGTITSSVDGDVQSLPDPDAAHQAQQDA